MTTARFFNNQQFRRYARFLRKLHQLIRDGTDETDEGEALRNQMDEPAGYLIQGEVDCLNAFSADFYSLTEPPSQVQGNPPLTLRDDLRRALDARDSGDFIKALDLVRKIDVYLDPAVAASFRGSTWLQASENEIALDFYQRAKELAPLNGGYAYMWLDTLSRVNPSEALETAERILQQSADHLIGLTLKATEVVFSSRRQLPGPEAVEVARRLIPAFEDIVIRMETLGETKAVPPLLGDVIGLLGICKIDVGEIDEARQWFDKGLRLLPNNLALLIARGIHLYGTDPECSRQDFQQAIRLEPRLVWPYFFLAHYYLVREQYRDCLEMAQSALSLAPSDALRADCLEWIAICQANLGYPPESVRAVFQVAQQLAPDNQRIATNHQLFEDNVLGTAQSKIRWESATSETVQSLGLREFQPA